MSSTRKIKCVWCDQPLCSHSITGLCDGISDRYFTVAQDLEGRSKSVERILWALQRLCDEKPPEKMVRDWLRVDVESDDLQHWVSAHIPAGVMAIAVIEAAEKIGMECEE